MIRSSPRSSGSQGDGDLNVSLGKKRLKKHCRLTTNPAKRFVMNWFTVQRKFIHGFKKLAVRLLPNYIKKNNGHKRIFVSYITEPLKRKHDAAYFQGHQNHQETVIIEEILNELDLSYIFNHYSLPLNFVWQKFDIVFGLEPNFARICQKNPDAIKIYYATGSYFKHQNGQIQRRTDEFKQKYSVDYPYVRMVAEHDSC